MLVMMLLVVKNKNIIKEYNEKKYGRGLIGSHSWHIQERELALGPAVCIIQIMT